MVDTLGDRRTRRPHLGHRRPGRVRQGGAGGGARRAGRHRRPLGQGPAVHAGRGPGDRRHPVAGRPPRRAGRRHAGRPAPRGPGSAPAPSAGGPSWPGSVPTSPSPACGGTWRPAWPRRPASTPSWWPPPPCQRLGRSAELSEVLDPQLVVPQVGQGALAVECRSRRRRHPRPAGGHRPCAVAAGGRGRAGLPPGGRRLVRPAGRRLCLRHRRGRPPDHPPRGTPGHRRRPHRPAPPGRGRRPRGARPPRRPPPPRRRRRQPTSSTSSAPASRSGLHDRLAGRGGAGGSGAHHRPGRPGAGRRPTWWSTTGWRRRRSSTWPRPTAERIDVGKSPGGPVHQDEINALLVERGRAGQAVVRLKGGDPFVFGRGGEEAAALLAAGVPFEVVPGVSSAVGVPAYAGIPVTHRGLSTSFTVVTGHSRHAVDDDIDWEALARVGDTVVVLMGVAHRAEIARRLIDGGAPPSTPVAAIRWGTRPDQRTIRTTLGRAPRLPPRAARHHGHRQGGGPRPAVVRVPAPLRPADRRHPGPPPGVGPGRAPAGHGRRGGGGADHRDRRSRRRRRRPARGGGRVRDYDWVCFTSTNAVERFLACLADARAFGDARVAAIGPGTAAALAAAGIVADLVPDRSLAEGLVDAFPDPRPHRRPGAPPAPGRRRPPGAGRRPAGQGMDGRRGPRLPHRRPPPRRPTSWRRRPRPTPSPSRRRPPSPPTWPPPAPPPCPRSWPASAPSPRPRPRPRASPSPSPPPTTPSTAWSPPSVSVLAQDPPVRLTGATANLGSASDPESAARGTRLSIDP